MALSRWVDNDTDFFANTNPIRALLDTGLLGPSILASHTASNTGGDATHAAPIRLDVVEKPEAFLIKADVPGVAKKNVKVNVDGDLLSIAVENEGGSQKEEDIQGVRFHRMERHKSYARRTIRLPDSADTDQISAKINNGVLEIPIPKKQTAQQRKRQINVADEEANGNAGKST